MHAAKRHEHGPRDFCHRLLSDCPGHPSLQQPLQPPLYSRPRPCKLDPLHRAQFGPRGLSPREFGPARLISPSYQPKKVFR